MTEQKRFLALDVFRGMTICFMIIVNSPGDWGMIYAPLEHAPWHGFTPTDLVFPSFLFAVGNAMAFIMNKYETPGNSAFWTKTLKRTFLIFLIGYLLGWFPFVQIIDSHVELTPIGHTRIPGVLQRIALCYFFASVIIYHGSRKFALLFSTCALLGYWIILRLYGDLNDPYSMVGNAVLNFDLLVFGESHMYHGEGIAFDPEGILSTLPAIVNVIAGYLAGDFMRKLGNTYEAVAKMMIAGTLLILVALAWDMAFPINKKIWTSSYVLLTIGIDLMIISILIYVVEILKHKKWTNFFTVFGKNPLFIYILADVLIITLYIIPVGDSSLQGWIYNDLLRCIFSPLNASLFFALLFMLACWTAGYFMDKKQIYIKL